MKKIKITFDDKNCCYIVSMPDGVTLDMLKDWQFRFDKILAELPQTTRYSLLIDTGKHDFESVDCLKFLRRYLSNKPEFKTRLKKGAFVAPPEFVKKQVKSNVEASFNDYNEAYKWIKSDMREEIKSSG